MRIAIAQMTSGIDPLANAAALSGFVADAAAGGAAMLFTPEMAGLIDRDRKRAAASIVQESESPVLQAVRDAAAKAGLWVHLGSLPVKSEQGDARYCNRGFVIDGSGDVRARYDKLHMFDVDLPTGESWRESAAYAPGEGTCVVETPVGTLGLSICYDLRFPALFNALSAAGAQILAVPSAFTVPTGQAHWHVLLRARAIENACWLVAAAQSGAHADGRMTFGHSLLVNPWGETIIDMESAPGLAFAEIDLAEVEAARSRIPVIAHRRAIPPVTVIQ